MEDEKLNNVICMNVREFRNWCCEMIENRCILFNNTVEDNFNNNYTCGFNFLFDELTGGINMNLRQLKCKSGCVFTMNRVKHIICELYPNNDEIQFTVVCGNLKNDKYDVRYHLVAVNKIHD